MYKGRYDCIFAKNGILVLNDFKGASKKKSKKWLKDYPLQIAAYIKALEEVGVVINWGMITVILNDQIQTFVYDHCEIEFHFQQFLKRLKQYNDETNANL
jgi:ATP-dependent exoDNAse (exonuclease V) beta subunit